VKLHEYQAKELLASYGIPIPEGSVASSPEEAREKAQKLGGSCVVKAQVHAGGRGKAGGIHITITPEEAEKAAKLLLGTRLVTAQTDTDGVPINHVLLEHTVDVEKELYLGIIIDGSVGGPVMIASQAGGMEIEEIAEKHPDLILRVAVDPVIGFQPFQARYLSSVMGLSAESTKAITPVLSNLYRLFIDKDCSMVEINPLVVTKEQKIIALDAKVTIEDDALFRQREMIELRDLTQEGKLEGIALEKGIAYVKLDGEVGCLVNGAGLAMATMDSVRAAGFNPANFLDVGGGADPDRVAETVSLVLEDPNVKRILVNVFGGIARCDDIAKGIAMAMPEDRKDIPLIVRFLGTNKEEGNQVLRESGLNIYPIADLNEGIEVLRKLATS
jgi:succinyl-CoA synthetase beta subunit